MQIDLCIVNATITSNAEEEDLCILLFVCTEVTYTKQCTDYFAIYNGIGVCMGYYKGLEAGVFTSKLPVVCFACVGVHVQEHLAGLVVKASTSRVADPGFDSSLCPGFSGVESHQ